MNTAYFDLANGIAGDIAIAALVHAGRRIGVPVERIVADAIASLGLDATVAFVDDERGGLACLRAEVKTTGERFTAKDLRAAIQRATASAHPKEQALTALASLVGAEAVVHGVDPDEVHLHELGSADTAADLLGTFVALEALGVDDVASAPVPIPSGWITTEHGALPLPAPVTLELLAGVAVKGTDATEELVTPTGAAIIRTAASSFGPAPAMVIDTIGIGAGKRIGTRPNISRVLIGERSRDADDSETCVVLETNIDDQTPEGIGHAVEQLIEHGALDAWVSHIVMKRSRPAFQLSALVRPDDEAAITEQIFRLTTTLGVRRRTTERIALDREELTVDVDGHHVRVKVGRLRGEVVNVAPEFRDCVAVADATGRSQKDVYAVAASHARQALGA